MAKITISVPDEVVEALTGGDKTALATMLKEFAVSTVALKLKLETKMNDLLYQSSFLLFLLEQLDKCKVEDVPRLALITVKATKTLLEMTKDVSSAQGYKTMIKLIETELELLESVIEGMQSGEVEEELKKVTSEVVNRGINDMATRIEKTLETMLKKESEDKGKLKEYIREKLEEYKSILIPVFIETGVFLRVQELRLMVKFVALQTLSLVLLLTDNLRQVITISDPLARILSEIKLKVEEPISPLGSGEHHSGLTI